MLWQNKITWSETIILSALYQSNKKEGDTFSDIAVWAGAGLGIARIWKPEIMVLSASWAAPVIVPAAAAVAAPVAVGVIVSGVIGGAEGIKDFGDFIVDVPLGKNQQKKFKEVVIPAIESEVIEPIANFIDDEVIKPIERKAEETATWFETNIFQPVEGYGRFFWKRYNNPIF